MYDEVQSQKLVKDIVRSDLGWDPAEHSPADYSQQISSAKNAGLYTAALYAEAVVPVPSKRLFHFLKMGVSLPENGGLPLYFCPFAVFRFKRILGRFFPRNTGCI